MPMLIHNKSYTTVAERIGLAKEDLVSVETEVLQHEPVVVVKATIFLKEGRQFTGISSANPLKVIEKTNPYEVAETSALGRALGFAGYGLTESIASADEMTKYPESKATKSFVDVNTDIMICKKHNVLMKLNKNGKPYHIANDEFCNGRGFRSEIEGFTSEEIGKQLDEAEYSL